MKKVVLVLFASVLSLGITMAQVNVKDSAISIPAFYITGGIQFPGGDLAERFGVNSIVGGGFYYKTKSHWFIEVQGNFMFGNQIEEDDILEGISTASGGIIAADGRFAEVRLFERGFQLGLTTGKLFPLNKPNPNSGIVLKAGPTFIQHKIKIDPIGNNVPQLNADYKKGYDRLSNGYGIYSFLGYQYLGNKRRINFTAGFEFLKTNTKNKRSYNFDQKKADTSTKNDVLYGIRVSWIVPLYKRSPDAYYYR